ncbi:hypothetical protein PN498_21445 [Oscillatoria sp. CS-180]|uniref:hypothetical protein n=1 Tax=Oscillatoria sp. CS-180 TaxID=3021720 RepID=UPI0023306434|nr:hypothetical protein [Oscillatoria sp. CS-180]MDB9528572.1 hypothetical protein [Oscillatoria sp. CS-180]
MNTKLIDSLIHIIQSLTVEERQALEAELLNANSAPMHTAEADQLPDLNSEPVLQGSKASDLLRFAGTWTGNDFEECLELVHETRSKAEF